MYAAFRWVEERNGKHIVAMGRTDVLSIYLKLGLQPLNQQIKAGAVTFELLATTENEEVSGGQVPRGYPRQEVPVGSGDVSGMCLTIDIPTPAYQPGNRPVCS
jgi:hypothetical protein